MASPNNLICFILFSVLNITIEFIHQVKMCYYKFIHFFTYIFYILYYFGEENFIKSKHQLFTYPKTIAIILNKENASNNALCSSFLMFIKWCLYTTNIKQLIIYDPFNQIDVHNLIQKITMYFNNNYSIGITFDKKAVHCRKGIEVNKKEMFSYDFNLIISFIKFNSANRNLIEDVLINNNMFPCELDFYEKQNINKKHNMTNQSDTYNSNYEYFYTRKKVEGMPELVICFGNEDICLYGFPFTLLENCEIKVIRNSFSTVSLVDFINVFMENAKVKKRFGF